MIHHRFFGVTAARQESHRAVANAPSSCLVTKRCNYTGALQPQNRRCTRRRRIKALPLHQVGSIYPGASDLDQQIGGPWPRLIEIAEPERVFIAGLIYQDRLHDRPGKRARAWAKNW